MRRLLCLLAVLALVPALALGVSAADMEETRPYIQQILNYYLHYGDDARPEIGILLDIIGEIDPEQEKTWEKIISDWGYFTGDMEVNPDVLPDGLPEDDSLCIVVMGYCLNPNGTIQPELEGRLTVALESARKYPNAYILCTGGPTARDGWTTEAGQMRNWLLERGIAWKRIIVEDDSLSTTENAMYSLPILQKKYPQIEKLAIITSDYHIPRSCLMFSAVADYRACYEGDRPLEIVSNAVYVMNSGITESRYSQAWGVAIVAGVEVDSNDPPNLERIPEETAAEPEMTVPVSEPVAEAAAVTQTVEADTGWEDYQVVLTIAAGFAALAALLGIWERRKG